MQKHRVIPSDCMTVGQLAKRMGTTPRTLQYYDQLGLLEPTELSSGGRRLYTAKDMVRLHQIQSMKYLGFSLDEISTHLIALDTPEDVAAALDGQAQAVRAQIESLTGVLASIETLRDETLKMQTVDWRRYGDIIALLRAGKQDYWFVKQLSDKTLDHIHTHFDDGAGFAMIDRWKQLSADLSALIASDAAPDSPQAQVVAASFWDFVTQFTGGDASLLPELLAFAQDRDAWDDKWRQQWEGIEEYLGQALTTYFERLGIDPFQEAQS